MSLVSSLGVGVVGESLQFYSLSGLHVPVTHATHSTPTHLVGGKELALRQLGSLPRLVQHSVTQQHATNPRQAQPQTALLVGCMLTLAPASASGAIHCRLPHGVLR